MRALQVTELIGPDGLRVVDVPDIGDGEGVLIDVRAVGVSYPDLLRSQGLYQERATPPYTLGGEVAGVVVDAPASTNLQPGERVAGATAGGAAERAMIDASAVLKLPADLSFEQGAALPLNYRTAILGLEVRGRLRHGETVLVHGAAGGTGTAAIQVARASECRTIAVVSSDLKADLARQAGADVVLRSTGPWKDEALQLTDGHGVDLVWDPVGGDRILDTMRVLAPGGRWVVVGFTGGDIPQVPLNRVLLRNIDVVGTYIGGYLAHGTDLQRRHLTDRLAHLLEGGHIRPVVGSVHAFEHGADALREIADRRAVGKVVISWTAPPQ
jgi:NADPH2:quinone reductase